MLINILQLADGARRAKGLTVIIDVFRAFTTSCYLIHNGAKHVIPVANLDTAYYLKRKYPHFLLIGERNGIPITGAEHGNSPSEIENINLHRRNIIFTSSAGTQGFESAKNASELITGSLVNAEAIITYINSRKPDEVSLVCMGHLSQRPSEEDTICAEYIRSRLLDTRSKVESMYQELKSVPSANKFFDPRITWIPERDFDLCTKVGVFNFILRLELNSSKRYYFLEPVEQRMTSA